MSGDFVKLALCHIRGLCQQVAALVLLVLNPALKKLYNLCALWQQDRQTLSDVVNRCEVFQLSAKLVMVALLRFFKALEVRVKLVLRGESRAVNTGEHLVLFAAAPVCARNRRELESLYGRCAHKVRACAKVGEITLLEEADWLALVRVLAAKLNLIRLAKLLKILYSLIGSHCKLLEPYALLYNLLHLRLNLRESVGSKRLLGVEIVVETVVDSRTNRKLCRGIKALYRLRENVRSGVVKRALPLLVRECQKSYRAVAVDYGAQVCRRAVNLRKARGLCLAKLSCKVKRRHRLLKLFDFSVFQCYLNHNEHPFLTGLYKRPAVQ